MIAADKPDSERRALLMQAISNQYAGLQSARGATIAESSSRSSLYLTTLTGSVVGLSFVAQASKFGDSFFLFALAVLPVVFFLGVVTYYRTLQTGVEDVIFARGMTRIEQFFSEIDPDYSDLFKHSSVDQVGLRGLGMFGLHWQQFLSSAAVVAIVNSVVGGVFITLAADLLIHAPELVAIVAGFVSAAVIAVAFLRHQWVTWMRVSKALPAQPPG